MVTVFNGQVTLSSTGSGTPNPFDFVINLASLFDYNPSQGDLLVDIFMKNSPSTTFFDENASPAGATARVFSLSGASGSYLLPTGSIGQNGLVTQFSFLATTVPDWYSVNLTSTSNVLNLATSTPGGGSGQFVNNLVPVIELFDPNMNLVATGTLGPDGRNQILQYVVSPSTGIYGTYTIEVIGQGNTSGEYFLSATTVGQSPTAPLSSLANTIIDDGTAQRSVVRSITVEFNGNIVSAPSSAFTLVQTESGLPVTVTATLGTFANGQTSVTLTFSGSLVSFGSLSDGHYTLSINGSQIRDSNGNMVDAGNTGTAGSVGTLSFHRFFGDMNGDGLVDATDFLVFRAAYVAYLSGDLAAYNSALDFDDSGTLTVVDLDAFMTNFLKRTLT